jgi:hypothetical protein
MIIAEITNYLAQMLVLYKDGKLSKAGIDSYFENRIRELNNIYFGYKKGTTVRYRSIGMFINTLEHIRKELLRNQLPTMHSVINLSRELYYLKGIATGAGLLTYYKPEGIN